MNIHLIQKGVSKTHTGLLKNTHRKSDLQEHDLEKYVELCQRKYPNFTISKTQNIKEVLPLAEKSSRQDMNTYALITGSLHLAGDVLRIFKEKRLVDASSRNVSNTS
jgi:folylpolyglutamate synthase/dihydropteroate synthase